MLTVAPVPGNREKLKDGLLPSAAEAMLIECVSNRGGFLALLMCSFVRPPVPTHSLQLPSLIPELFFLLTGDFPAHLSLMFVSLLISAPETHHETRSRRKQ